MSITVEWDDDAQTILRYSYSGAWTLDEFVASLDQAYALIDQQDHLVDLIHVILPDARTPSGMFSALGHIKAKRHPRQRHQIVIGASPFMKRLTQITGAVVLQAREVVFVDSLDEAYARLNIMRRGTASNRNG